MNGRIPPQGRDRAAADMPDLPYFGIADGKAYCRDETQNKNVTVDPATLPESVQALVALSEKTGVDFYRTDPEPVFRRAAITHDR